MKKNYIYLSLAIIATTYQAFSLMFYPELAPNWLIRFFGFLFILYAIGYVLEIQTLYLKNKIKTLDEKLEEFINPNIIDEWLKKNGDPEIAKQVELELEELCKKQSTKDRILSETSEDTKHKAIDYANALASLKETHEGRKGFIADGNWNPDEEVQTSDYEKLDHANYSQLLLELLKAIDDANPVDKLCSIKFYQDGSGVIYNGDTEIHGFDTVDQAIYYLKHHPVLEVYNSNKQTSLRS